MPIGGARTALAVSASTGDHITAPAIQTPARPADDDTPWGFFKEHSRHVDSLWKWLGLIFFTILLSGVYALQYLPAIAIAVAVLALISRRVRGSWLVKGGLALFFGARAALAIAGRFGDNALGIGFLYAFATPIAVMMMIAGALLALLKTNRGMKRDIAALVAAANERRPVWPDQPQLPQVDRVWRHGSRAARALVDLLGPESDDPSSGDRNVHVEQQAELALCRIYGVSSANGETVSDARSLSDANRTVREFWRRRVDGDG